MKLIVMSAAALVCLAPAAFAQTAPAAPANTAPATKFNLDTPIETLVADSKAMEVLAANGLGEVSQHPSYEMFKAMSLRAVQPMSGGKVTDEMLAKIDTGLAAIK